MTTILHQIYSLFDINTTFFTFLNYDMSYIEFFGTIFTIWCVWLTAKAKVLSWPIGIIGTILYMFLFYQISLYSDLFEQVYFLITSFVGWYVWLHPKTADETNKDEELKIGVNSLNVNLVYAIVVVIGTFVFTYITINLNIWLPKYFPEPAAVPFFDSLTTSMSFAAQWLLARKKVESWVLWIMVDAIDIWIYWFKGVRFVSLEYVLFLGIAIKGLNDWLKEYRSYSNTK